MSIFGIVGYGLCSFVGLRESSGVDKNKRNVIAMSNPVNFYKGSLFSAFVLADGKNLACL